MPSIGKDLAKIRNARGLSLQEIQAATKIPLTTLQSIENGTIFEQSIQGNTYTRSFIRSYGRALKIEDDILINGLDQQETGNYNHLLWNHYESAFNKPASGNFTLDDEDVESFETEQIQTVGKSKPVDKTPEPEVEETLSVEPDNTKNEPQQTASKPGNTDTADNDKVDADKKSSSKQPAEADVNWANMGHKFIESRKKTPIGIISLVVIIILLLAGATFLYQSGFFSSSDEPVSTTAQSLQNGSVLDLSEPDSPEPVEPVIADLDEILYLTVYAAYERLDPVRVWSDEKPRMDPYWIEQGTAMNFDFQDTIRIRGQYSNLLLFMNGHLIETPMETHFNQGENYIELTREFFTTDPVFRNSVSFQTPEGVAEPDSVIFRPSF